MEYFDRAERLKKMLNEPVRCHVCLSLCMKLMLKKMAAAIFDRYSVAFV
jgi:hypothetical protein